MSHLLLLLLLLFCKWTSANQSNPSKLHIPQGHDSGEDPARNTSQNIAGLDSLELMAKMEDMTAKIKLMEEMLEKREEEMNKKLREMQNKMEMNEIKIRAELDTIRESPQVLFCAYQNHWNSTGTVTFSQFISNFNNANQEGGGDGAMNLKTGVFTTLTSGHYTVTLSGYSALDAMVDNYLDLYHNGQMVWQLGYFWRQYHTGDLPSTLGVMASRTLILHLGAGDTLELRSTGPGGRVYHFVFCLNLTARDYSATSFGLDD